MGKNRYRVSDELWEKIEPLLPRHVNTYRFGGGRPRADDRKCMDGIFFVLRTGCQWNALNETGICPSSTAHDRFQEWVAAGVFQKLWAAGLQAFGYTPHIKARGEEARAIKQRAGFKARRWVVEQTHGWMNRFRRIFTRWEKKAANYLGLLHLVCAVITYCCAGLFG
jgi:transposase